MSKLTARRMCKTCGQTRLFEKERQNNVLHLLLSIVTCGLWLPVWLLVAVCVAFSPYRCPVCGKGTL